MYGYLLLSSPVYGCKWLYRLVYAYVVLCMAIKKNVWLCTPVSGCVGLSNVVYGPIYTIQFCRMRQAHDRPTTLLVAAF